VLKIILYETFLYYKEKENKGRRAKY